MANASKDELVATTLTALRARWRRVRDRLRRGRWRPAEEEAWHSCFEADSVSRRKALARRFYSVRHAEQVLALSDESLRTRIAYYAEAAVLQVWDEYDDDPVEQRRHMRSLITSEYVLIEQSPPFHEDGKWTVSKFPAPVLYDDWYERSVGADSVYAGRIMKSTGEPFSTREHEWLDASVRLTTWLEPEYWQSTTWRESPNRIFVYIVPVTRTAYLRAIKPEFLRGTRTQLIDLLRHVRHKAVKWNNPGIKNQVDRMLSKGRMLRKRRLGDDTWRLLVSRSTPPEYLVAASRAVSVW